MALLPFALDPFALRSSVLLDNKLGLFSRTRRKEL